MRLEEPHVCSTHSVNTNVRLEEPHVCSTHSLYTNVKLDEPHILSKTVCNRQRERAARRASHLLKGSTRESVCMQLEEPHILSSAVQNRECVCAARRASHSLRRGTQHTENVCGSTSLTFSQRWCATRRECVRLDEP